MPHLRSFLGTLLPLALLPFSGSALTINGFSSELHDRFANDPDFLFDAFDLSGVGRSSDTKWATLVSNNVFLSANHSRPSIGATVTFHLTNDPNGATESRTVSGGQRIGSSDLWIGTLDTPVSDAIASYDIVTTDLTQAGFSSSDLFNDVVGTIGRSPSTLSSLIDVSGAYNVLDAYFEDVEVDSTTDDALISVYRESSNNFSILQGGDSGGPLFAFLENDSIALLGINWFVGELEQEGTTYDISGFSYLGKYDAEVRSYISLQAVPEPATWALLLGAISLLAVSRRRNASAIS